LARNIAFMREIRTAKFESKILVEEVLRRTRRRWEDTMEQTLKK
jgi:hypothetical protein